MILFVEVKVVDVSGSWFVVEILQFLNVTRHIVRSSMEVFCQNQNFNWRVTVLHEIAQLSRFKFGDESISWS